LAICRRRLSSTFRGFVIGRDFRVRRLRRAGMTDREFIGSPKDEDVIQRNSVVMYEKYVEDGLSTKRGKDGGG
jgi:hypothetical protein